MTALQRHSVFHLRHHFEVVSFHAVWAANGIEIGHIRESKKSPNSFDFRGISA